MSLKELRSRIKSVGSTRKITMAMKMVASARLKRAQDKVARSRAHSLKLEIMAGLLGKSLADLADVNPWLKKGGERDLIIAFGAGKGLCGGFHGNSRRHALTVIEKFPNARLLLVGKKLKESLAGRYGDRFVDYDLDDKNADPNAFFELGEYLERAKGRGEFDRVYAVGARFKNILAHEFQTQTLCPFNFTSSRDTTIFEPSPEAFLTDFLKRYAAAFLYGAWVETVACETASRVSAMDNASRNASSMLDDLSLRYNRTRQAKITTELMEIISGYQSIEG